MTANATAIQLIRGDLGIFKRIVFAGFTVLGAEQAPDGKCNLTFSVGGAPTKLTVEENEPLTVIR